MTFDEADKMFQVWRKWYWPCHTILHSIFGGRIPISYCPYPVDTLEEALNIIAKYYFDTGDHKTSKLIQESIVSLWEYTEDEAALEEVSKKLSNPEMREIALIYISNYKKDWEKWLEKQDEVVT